MQHTKKDPQKRVLTIPNLLSLFRIILLPLFVWLYVFRQRYLAAAAFDSAVVCAVSAPQYAAFARDRQRQTTFGTHRRKSLTAILF